MAQLTLEIADDLNAVLTEASQRRHRPKSEIARELLEQVLLHRPTAGAAQHWLSNWRGSLREKPQDELEDARLAHLIGKHLR